MLDHLLTEARNPASADLDRLTPPELVRLMNAEDARAPAAVAAVAEDLARAVEAAAGRLRGGGRLIYLGAGTSGRLGVLDAAECPPTFGSPPGLVVGLIAGGPAALTAAVEGAEDDPARGEADLRGVGLTANDAVVGIATSGRTPYVIGGLAYARRTGALAVGLACTPGPELAAHCDVLIAPLVGPEVLTGSTRLKAGTATKLVLNTLSTGVMVLLGKTYGNLMVDLRATNAKLRARANRIVRHFTGLPADEAERLLAACGGELKTALVARQAGVSPEGARERLVSAGGRVRDALDTAASPARGAASGLLLGVDGGGSHTVALLAEPRGGGGWRVLGRGAAGPSNLRAAGPGPALAALDAAVAAAFAAAGLSRGPVSAACLGLAGAGRPDEQALVRNWAARNRLAAQVEVVTDAELLLEAGTPDGWGLALVSGTGSIAWARAADGRAARAGGWGPLLGDEGSGYALALEALRAVARAADGRGPTTALTAPLLASLNAAGPSEMVARLHGGGWDRPVLAALAPRVLEAAEAGDPVAVGIVGRAAADLAETAAAAARAVGFGAAPVPVAVAGGLLLGSAPYRERVVGQLAERGVTPGSVTAVVEPAEGAVRRAAWARKLPRGGPWPPPRPGGPQSGQQMTTR